ncbi:MAG: bifunctional glutamate N-acetyltransferase/amino-acid acetyltransferase ArgJ [bacterium]
MKIIEQGNLALVKGIQASGIHCGIKTSTKKDLALVFSESPAHAAGVFSSNRIIAAPLVVTREHLSAGQAQAIIANSGIANAATGQRGIDDARRMAHLTASSLNIPEDSVVVASTGMIGRFLPMKRIESGIREAVCALSTDGGADAAEAIMTTDTCPKHLAVRINLEGRAVTLAGMAKGAGMIQPDMATMLAFLATDAAVERDFLRDALRDTVARTFNCITIDGDTSTNDMVVILANGLSGNTPISARSNLAQPFMDALELVCSRLSLMIVEDGEGATKLVSIEVRGAKTHGDARAIAFRIANSPLVKTSLYGRRCNWGRIMAAAGSSGVAVDPDRIDIFYGNVQVVRNGLGLGREKEAEALLGSRQVALAIDLHLGDGGETVWTSDLSPEYIHINADYAT